MARRSTQPRRALWRVAAFLRAGVGAGGLAKSFKNRSRSRSESLTDDSSANGNSSSGTTFARRTRISNSLTCSMTTVELANDLGKTSLAFASVVLVSVRMWPPSRDSYDLRIPRKGTDGQVGSSHFALKRLVTSRFSPVQTVPFFPARDPLHRQVHVNNQFHDHATTSGSSRSSSRQAA